LKHNACCSIYSRVAKVDCLAVHAHTKCRGLRRKPMRTSNMLKAGRSMRELTKAEIDKVAGGAIVKQNGGGNTPNGNANGVPNVNPAGHEPPGQN
jgi:hypothetical protein